MTEGPLPPIASFDRTVAEAFDGERSAGYLWVKVTLVGQEQAVTMTLSRRTGDAQEPWEHLEIDDPEGSDAYPALLAGEVDWFGPPLRLRWLADHEVAAVIDDQGFSDPWGAPSTVLSELRESWRGLKDRFKRG